MAKNNKSVTNISKSIKIISLVQLSLFFLGLIIVDANKNSTDMSEIEAIALFGLAVALEIILIPLIVLYLFNIGKTKKRFDYLTVLLPVIVILAYLDMPSIIEYQA